MNGPTAFDLPRWRLTETEELQLQAAWLAWLESITEGYFGEQAGGSQGRAVTLCAIAEGMAGLVASVLQRRVPKRRHRVKRANRQGKFGPGTAVHDSLVESLANAAQSLGHELMGGLLWDVAPIVAANGIARAAQAALLLFFGARTANPGARQTLRIEYREALRRLAPDLELV